MKVGDKVEYRSKIAAYVDEGEGVIVSIDKDVIGVKVYHGISYIRKQDIKRVIK